MKSIVSALRSLFWRSRRNAEIDEELRSFVESSIEEKMLRGMTREQAQRAALAEVGSATMVKDKIWSSGWESLADAIWQDVVYAVRSAKRSLLLSIVAVVALALGIGLNAGMFTLLNAMFLTPPTQQDPASFVRLYPHYEGWSQGVDRSFTTEDYEAMRDRSTTLKEVAAFAWTSTILDQEPRGQASLLLSCNYFSVFSDSRPLLGRLPVADDCKRGGSTQITLLDESVWRQHFNANQNIVGETIHLNGMPFTVVGVVRTGSMNIRLAGIYVPYTDEPVLNRHSVSLLAAPDSPWLEIAGRLRPGISRATAQAELQSIVRDQDQAWLEHKVSTLNRKTRVVLTNGAFIQNPAVRDSLRVVMALIMGPLSLVLLLACTNVTMLFLSRGMVRRGEMAVRLALGAGRKRLLRMIVVESLLTTVVAGVLSVALARSVPQMLLSKLDPASMYTTIRIPIDWHVFGYLAGMVVVASAISSVVPTHAAWGLDLVSALKGRDGTVTTRSRMTGGLIVAQVAMSFVLLAAAILFARLPAKVTGLDAGFEIRHLLPVPLDVDTTQAGHDRAAMFQKEATERIGSLPGVESLAWTDFNPFHGIPPVEVRLPGQEKSHGAPAMLYKISADFFSTFGIGLLRGRALSSTDWTPDGSSAAVVSAALAQKFWPHDDPIGKGVLDPGGHAYTVVGIAEDLRSEKFGTLDGPRMYLLRDPQSVDGQLYVRFTGSSQSFETAVRATIKALDPTMLTAPQTVWESLLSDAEGLRTLGHIVVAMATLAVLLAVTGIYAALSFAMQQQKREVGIRMVLGADRSSIFRAIMLRGGLQISFGLITGVVIAMPVAWTFTHLMAKESPVRFQGMEGPACAIAGLVLLMVSLTAMFLPALRATQADPMTTLRME